MDSKTIPMLKALVAQLRSEIERKTHVVAVVENLIAQDGPPRRGRRPNWLKKYGLEEKVQDAIQVPNSPAAAPASRPRPDFWTPERRQAQAQRIRLMWQQKRQRQAAQAAAARNRPAPSRTRSKH